MPEIKLKPCPFCGSSVRFDKAYSYFRDSVIYCDNCDMIFTLDDCQSSDDEICEAWNRRATRHAHWIKIGEDCRGYSSIFDCSGCEQTTYLELPAKECDYDFCPNCGAEMDGGESNAG